MVLEVGGVRIPEFVAPEHPLAEGEAVGDRLEPVLADSDQHHPRVEGVGGPGVRARRPHPDRRGPGRIERLPHAEARRSPPARRTIQEGGVGERGGERRSDPVGLTPAGLHIEVRIGARTQVEIGLHGCGTAHHHAAQGAEGVEVPLHRHVAGRLQDPPRGSQGVPPHADERDAVVRQVPAQVGTVLGDRLAGRGRQVGRRAELQLSARLEADPAPARQRPRRRDGSARVAQRDMALRVVGRDRQPLDLDTGMGAERRADGTPVAPGREAPVTDETSCSFLPKNGSF